MDQARRAEALEQRATKLTMTVYKLGSEKAEAMIQVEASEAANQLLKEQVVVLIAIND